MSNKRPITLNDTRDGFEELKDEDVIPVSVGGTGGNTPSEARSSLGVPSSTELSNIQQELSEHKNASNPHNLNAVILGAIPNTAKATPNGVATLDTSGKVPVSQLPATSRPIYVIVDDQAARLAIINPQSGDECLQLSDDSKWIHNGTEWKLRPSANAVTIFGSEYHEVCDEEVWTTTYQYWMRKLRINATNLPSGRYRIEVSYMWNTDSTSSDFLSMLMLSTPGANDAPDVEWHGSDPQGKILMHHLQEPKDSGGQFENTGSDQRHPAAFITCEDLSGDIELNLLFRTTKNGEEASMWNASMSMWRVS